MIEIDQDQQQQHQVHLQSRLLYHQHQLPVHLPPPPPPLLLVIVVMEQLHLVGILTESGNSLIMKIDTFVEVSEYFK